MLARQRSRRPANHPRWPHTSRCCPARRTQPWNRLEEGDGGRIETSGYRLEINNSSVSTESFSGKDGEWLLDPYNIEISGSGGSDYTANEDDEVINASTLVSALASSNITVRTDGGGSQDGDITVSSAISSSSGNYLTLQSNNDII